MTNIVKILAIKEITHDVKSFRIEKPDGYHFKPGQATDVSVNRPDMKNEKRPFTYTSLDDEYYLEFTIKRYGSHHGVTEAIHQLLPDDELLIEEAWGAIQYKGPGYFIAGGAGITPFLAILRHLHKKNTLQGNTLFFSNKTSADIICREELVDMLGDQAKFVITNEDHTPYIKGYINEEFVKQNVTDFSKNFYVCGPDPMVKDITSLLEKLGAKPDTVVFEK